jgi:acetyl esterase/lipase
MALWLSAAAIAEPEYPPVAAGVSFDAVLALPYSEEAALLRYGEHPAQLISLTLPEQAAGPAPVVVLVHGGCWLNAFNAGHTRAMATALSQAGFAVWSVEYRRLGDEGGGWPGSLDDITAALALLAERSGAALDLTRVAVVGHSAGGHLALLAAADPPDGLGLRAVVGLAPITDIAHYAGGENSCNRAAAQFIDGLSAAELALANPALSPAPPGTVLFYGTQDRIVPFEVPYLKPELLVTLPAGHFDWIHPGTPAFERLRSELARVLQ